MAAPKTGFSVNDLKSSKPLLDVGADFQMKFDSRLGWTFFKVRKLVSRSARSQSNCVPLTPWLLHQVIKSSYNDPSKSKYWKLFWVTPEEFEVFVFVLTEDLLKTELFEKYFVAIITWFPCPSFSQTKIQKDPWLVRFEISPVKSGWVHVPGVING